MVHLQPGDTIGPYRIETLVGEGGMGAVYRATDTRLHRTVAIKLVAPGLSANPESRARFEREGRLLASLNHPNVAAIHGMEEFQGVRALVLEFVEGHTLADVIVRAHPSAESERLRSGPRDNEGGVAASRGGAPRALRIDDALRIARQIALALTAAHDKGIVHRDLKPANIKITPTGDVKVLDFGIAKLAASPDEFPSETAATRAAEPTREGTIVGTAAYMSPEQARGHPADKRADIWAYGCVLYEMLAGRRAFDGATWSDTVAKVIEREPDWDALPANLPGAIRTLVRRCLQKNPGDRRQDLADVPFEIADALSSPAPPPGVRVRPKRWPIAIAGATAAATLAVWAAWTVNGGRAGGVPAPASVEFGVTFPDNSIPSAGIAVSPDGRYIAAGVYSTDENLWLHTLESSVTRPLAGGEGSDAPFWSPDSRTLGFCGPGGLFKMTLPDGPPSKVGDVCTEGTWNGRDEIVVASRGELFKIPASGGVPERLPVPEGRYPVAPQFLPDDRHVIYTDSSRGVGPVVVMSIDGKEHRELVATDAPALFVPPHHLLFVRGTALMAQVFEPERLALEGTPVLVAPNVLLGLQQGRRAQVSASANGVLAFGTSLGGSNGQLTWFNRLGQRAASISAPQGSEFLSPALSPDGQLLAVHHMDPQIGNWDIWKIDLEQGTPSKLTTNDAQDTDPVWSPDGKQIVFASDRSGQLGLYRKAVDGSGPEELLLTVDGSNNLVATDWSRDGRYIIYHQSRPERPRIFALPLFGDRRPIHLAGPEFGPYGARLSPDGRWLAYVSFESGPSEVHVQRFLEPGQKQRISNGGGTHPRWTNNGRELVYWVVLGGIDAVDFKSDGTKFRIGPRRPLVQAPVLTLIDGRTKYDVTRDGQRLIVRQPAGPQGPGIGVILNWTERLKP